MDCAWFDINSVVFYDSFTWLVGCVLVAMC